LVTREQSNQLGLFSQVEITQKGKYNGLLGIVTKYDAENREAEIELKINGKVITRNQKYLRLHRRSKKIKKSRQKENIMKDKNKKPRKKKKLKSLKWVVPNIRVRICSQKIFGGELYLEKVIVNDVGLCSFEVLTKKGSLQ